MKHLIILLFSTIFLYSCDPDIPGEGVTFEPLDFTFTVKNDSAIQQFGDTMFFHSSLPNINKLNGGKLNIFASFYYFDTDTIRYIEDIQRGYEDSEYRIFFNKGTYENHSTGFLREIRLYPRGEDSLIFDFYFIPLKRGIHKLVFRSSFYEGEDGKARTNAKFDVTNPNWGFYSPFLGETPLPSDDRYNRSFIFRVE